MVLVLCLRIVVIVCRGISYATSRSAKSAAKPRYYPLAPLQRTSSSRGNTMTTTPDFRAELEGQ